MIKRKELISALATKAAEAIVIFGMTVLVGFFFPKFIAEDLNLMNRYFKTAAIKVCTAGGLISGNQAGDVHLSVIGSSDWTYADCRTWVNNSGTNADNMRLDCIIDGVIHPGVSASKENFNEQSLKDFLPKDVQCGWNKLSLS